MKRSQMRRGRALKLGVKPLARAPMSRKPSKRQQARTKVLTELRQEMGACERCGGRAQHLHHRVLRSQGGGDERSNLAALCFACHDHVHANPAESYEQGWLVHRPKVALGICDLCGVESAMRFVGSNGFCPECCEARFG